MSRLDDILALPKVTHTLEQGSPAWDAFRLEHDGASEAAAMLGLSKKVKRSELMHQKHTGLPREFSDWLQKNVLDNGHRVEAMARPHIEALIGDELYPVTCSRGRTSASCDGLTIDDRIAAEHKQWAEDLAAMVGAGVLPDEHWPQCQQILLVTGAEKLYFVVSDGTPEKMVYLVVTPEREKWEQLANGWHQFNVDRAAYEPPAAAAVVVASPVQALPAVTVQVAGSIVVTDNFATFETALRDFLEHRLIRQPKTDQDFADLDVQIKAMKGAEAALESAEVQMLAQIQAVDTAKKAKDMLTKLVRDNRLMAERMLASEKERRRAEIVTGGARALRDHVDTLNQRLGRPYMPPEMAVANFAGAIKGLRSLASMEEAVAVTLANAKIAANETADRIEINLRHLVEHASEFKALFPDASTIVLKKSEDLQSLVTARIAEHRAAEEKRAAELAERERERIRAEEQERARQQQERRAKVQERIDAIKTAGAGLTESEHIAGAIRTLQSCMLTEDLLDDRVKEAALARVNRLEELEHAHIDAVERERAAEEERRRQARPELLERARGIVADIEAAEVLRDAIAAQPAAANVHQLPTRAPDAPAGPPTLKLGEINRRLAPLSITAEGLAQLGFPVAATERGAKLYHESDWIAMVDAMTAHLEDDVRAGVRLVVA